MGNLQWSRTFLVYKNLSVTYVSGLTFSKQACDVIRNTHEYAYMASITRCAKKRLVK